jgi:hypothetical protein
MRLWIDRFHTAKAWCLRNSNIVFFVGGFLFDLLTLTRIDAWIDLSMQAGYLSLITVLIFYQVREELGLWSPPARLVKLWHYNVEALHFCYGALLSAYVIFYFRSASITHTGVFLFLVLVLMFANEMPQVKKAGRSLRLGLHAFCIASYLNYLIPVLVGRMNVGTFFLALIVTAGIMALMTRRLTVYYEKAGFPRRATMASLGWPPVLVLVILGVFYVMKWIPPVPLSLQFSGIYHDVARHEERYVLTYRQPPWRVWKRESDPFYAAPGDVVHCFVRIFAPTRFRHQIVMHWQVKTPNGYRTTDRVPLVISGGRDQGYRGVSAKSNFEPGAWRVAVETSDERVIGVVDFRIVSETAPERQLRTAEM